MTRTSTEDTSEPEPPHPSGQNVVYRRRSGGTVGGGSVPEGTRTDRSRGCTGGDWRSKGAGAEVVSRLETTFVVDLKSKGAEVGTDDRRRGRRGSRVPQRRVGREEPVHWDTWVKQDPRRVRTRRCRGGTGALWSVGPTVSGGRLGRTTLVQPLGAFWGKLSPRSCRRGPVRKECFWSVRHKVCLGSPVGQRQSYRTETITLSLRRNSVWVWLHRHTVLLQ